MLLDCVVEGDRLTITEQRTLAAVVGGALLIAGLIVLGSVAVQGGHASDVVIGATGTVIGAFVSGWWPRRRTILDRGADSARVETILGRRVTRIRVFPLHDVAAVIVERSAFRANRFVFRPELVLRSGARIALAMNATGFEGLEADVARQVREWLGVSDEAPAPPAVGGRPAAPPRAPMGPVRRWTLRLFTAAALLAGVTLALIGIRMQREQSAELRTWRPTRALVVFDSLNVWHDRRGQDRVRPVVRYRFAMNGRTYASERVWPIGRRGSRAWGDSLLRANRVGDSVTAYVNPADPRRAYLDRTPTSAPTEVIEFGTALAVAGLLGLWGTRRALGTGPV